MEQEEVNIPGVVRRHFLKRDSTLLSLNFLATESQEEKEKKRLENMLNMSTLF